VLGQAIENLADERHRNALRGLLEGRTRREVAEGLGLNPRSVGFRDLLEDAVHHLPPGLLGGPGGPGEVGEE